jgi:glycosyltransferase involved in cell wall biosynthesis
MKLLVFAHTPPPHHGQSYMVKLMLDGFGGDCRKRKEKSPDHFGIECYHVNSRYSKTLGDVGEFQGSKIFLVLFYCLQAIWCRLRHGVTNLYYVPAPGKAVAVYRDWLVMFVCRPFFKKIILHWHAAGLAKWLETSVQIRSRALTYRLFEPVDLSIVLSRYNLADAEKLLSRHIRVVGNGAPDPCPDFAQSILPLRRARVAARNRLFAGEKLGAAEIAQAGGDPQVVKILFLAHCMREKGLFDALEGVVLAGAQLQKMNSPLQLHFTVGGEFASQREQSEFNRRVAQFATENAPPAAVTYLGFLSGEQKRRAFVESDCFCFPTFYHAESFGLVLIEAMTYGLPIVTTRWRSIPELFPENYPGLVDIRSPTQIAHALIRLATGTHDWPAQLRDIFKKEFTVEHHLASVAEAIHSVENI